MMRNNGTLDTKKRPTPGVLITIDYTKLLEMLEQ